MGLNVAPVCDMIEADGGDDVQEGLDGQLGEMLDAIARRIAGIYHMSEAEAHAAMRQLSFYSLLTAEGSPYRQDTEEANFRRMQNEIEYGAWDYAEAVGKQI